jgi:hypothetical protein
MPLAADALAALAAKGLTLATAEATTGGLIGHLLTEIPGSSRVFRGGVAPYANALKQAIGVPASLLAEHGAVSREAAEALASAVREWPARTSASPRQGSPAPEARAQTVRQASSGSLSRTRAGCGASASSLRETAPRIAAPVPRQRCACCSTSYQGLEVSVRQAAFLTASVCCARV